LAYVDAHIGEYNDLIAFLVSKNANFNVQAQNSHKHLLRKLLLLESMTADMDKVLDSPPKISVKSGNLSIRREYPYSEVYAKLLKTIDHPHAEIRQVSLRVIVSIYEKKGFDKIKDFISKLSNKVLMSLVKLIPESEPYIQMNEDRIKAANRTNLYGGGGSFGWAPNLQSTAQKQAKLPAKKSNISKSPDWGGEEPKKKVQFKEEQKEPKQGKKSSMPRC